MRRRSTKSMRKCLGRQTLAKQTLERWLRGKQMLMLVERKVQSQPPQLLWPTLRLLSCSEEAVPCGEVHMLVMNCNTGDYEERILEEVYYTPKARSNFIALSYMLMEAGYQLGIAKDKTKIWLWKPSMRLEFVLKDGLYRLWTI
jgi:hypothetical protein